MANLPAELGPNEIYRACDPPPSPSRPPPTFPTSPRSSARSAPSRRSSSAWASTDGATTSSPSGPPGTGKTTTVYDFLKRQAASLPAPDDWIYVYNFAKPYQPNAIRMPAGKAQEFRKDMEKLVEDLQAAITQAFESEEYEKQKRDHRPAGRRAAGGQARAR